MITICTTYKPFLGNDDIRQRNSLLSWFALAPNVEVMVFGSPAAPSDIAARFDAKHFPDHDWNGTGMPRIDKMFEFVQARARHDLISYINGDIVLGSDYLQALQSIPSKSFLMVGERWETKHLEQIPNATISCIVNYRKVVQASPGFSAGPGAMDYFGFRRGSIGQIAPLVPGAVLWDNFMVSYFKRCGFPVVDASHDVLAIHQTHAYKETTAQVRVLEDGPAARHNRVMLNNINPFYIQTPCTARDATLFLRGGHLIPFWCIPTAIIHRCHQTLLRTLRTLGLYYFIKRFLSRIVFNPKK